MGLENKIGKRLKNASSKGALSDLKLLGITGLILYTLANGIFFYLAKEDLESGKYTKQEFELIIDSNKNGDSGIGGYIVSNLMSPGLESAIYFYKD